MLWLNSAAHSRLFAVLTVLLLATLCLAKNQTYDYTDVDLVGYHNDSTAESRCYDGNEVNTSGKNLVYLPVSVWGVDLLGESSHCNKTVEILANGKVHTGKVFEAFTGTDGTLKVSEHLFKQWQSLDDGDEIKNASWKFSDASRLYAPGLPFLLPAIAFAFFY